MARPCRDSSPGVFIKRLGEYPQLKTSRSCFKVKGTPQGLPLSHWVRQRIVSVCRSGPVCERRAEGRDALHRHGRAASGRKRTPLPLTRGLARTRSQAGLNSDSRAPSGGGTGGRHLAGGIAPDGIRGPRCCKL